MTQKQIKPLSSLEVRDQLSDLARRPFTKSVQASSMLSGSLSAGVDNRRGDGAIQSIISEVIGNNPTKENISELLRRLENEHGIKPKDALSLLRQVSIRLSSEVLRIFEMKDLLDEVANGVEASIERGEQPARFDKAKYNHLVLIIARVMTYSPARIEEIRDAIKSSMVTAFGIDDKCAGKALSEIIREFDDSDLRNSIVHDINTILNGNPIPVNSMDSAIVHVMVGLVNTEPEHTYLPYILIARDLAKKLACDLKLYETTDSSAKVKVMG